MQDAGMIDIDEQPVLEYDLDTLPFLPAGKIEVEDTPQDPDHFDDEDGSLPAITIDDEDENHEAEDHENASWRPGQDVGGFVTRRRGQGCKYFTHQRTFRFCLVGLILLAVFDANFYPWRT